MPNSNTLDERLRSVEQAATETARVMSSPEAVSFSDARRDAAEMVQLIKERHEGVGAHPDVIAATVTAGGTP